MPFVRRKRGRLLLVHSRREGGRVVQEELVAFDSADEVDGILSPAMWATWKRTLERRYPDLKWDWDGVRRDLVSGAAALRPAGPSPTVQRLAGLAIDLAIELIGLSPAKAGDAAIIAELRPAFGPLLSHLNRVLGSAADEFRSPPMHIETDPAQSIFDDAMEHWWNGDRAAAVRGYKRALKVDPRHGDAHNHIGIADMDKGRLDDAERHFRAAIDGSARTIEPHGGSLEWANLDNRSYLRAHGNLALALRKRGKWADAMEIHEQMLRWNPNDNQGVRFLLGEEYHRLGNHKKALAAYKKCEDDVSTLFGMGMLLLELGRVEEGDRALLKGIAENRYLVPILLGDNWARLDAWHGSNLAEPEHAADVAELTGDLWRISDDGFDHLADLWHAPSVQNWRNKLDDIMVALRDAPGSTPNRSALLSRRYSLVSDEEIERVRQAVRAGGVAADAGMEGEHERFDVGNSYVTDMRHRVAPAEADLPPAFWRIVAYEGRIVEAGSAWARADTLESAIRCRRKPRSKACPGHLRVRAEDSVILWACTRCRDQGRISAWQGLQWDFSAAAAPSDAVRVAVSWGDFATLRKITTGPVPYLVARAEFGVEGPTLVASARELRFAATASATTGAQDLAGALLTAAGPADGGFEA
jgi:tetratricopeptide (TPR) repeat protein